MHKIRRQILELELPREQGAAEQQRRASRLFQEQVLPRLDAAFTRLAPADVVIQMDRLEIDLGDIQGQNWEQVFVERCVQQVDEQVRKEIKRLESGSPSAARQRAPKEEAWQTLLYYFQYGVLPWYASGRTLFDLEQQTQSLLREQTSKVRDSMLPLLRQHTAVLQRLFWQFSPEFASTVLEISLDLPTAWSQQTDTLWQEISGQPPKVQDRITLWGNLLNTRPFENIPQPPTRSFVANLLEKPGVNPNKNKRPNADRDSDFSKQKNNSAAPENKSAQTYAPTFPEDGLFIELAGLTIVAPYLSTCFSALQFLDGQEFPTPEQQHRAVHLLYYLATGNEAPEEPLLALPKLLCGMDLEASIPSDLKLNEVEKNECSQLLKAVVRNWAVLKNTGPDGLRSSFLLRNGKLSWEEDQMVWLLKIERLGQDLLLEKLPWPISIIKLPWMQHRIQVEW